MEKTKKISEKRVAALALFLRARYWLGLPWFWLGLLFVSSTVVGAASFLSLLFVIDTPLDGTTAGRAQKIIGALVEAIGAWRALIGVLVFGCCVGAFLGGEFRRALKKRAQFDPKKAQVEERITLLRGEKIARQEQEELGSMLRERCREPNARPAKRPSRL